MLYCAQAEHARIQGVWEHAASAKHHGDLVRKTGHGSLDVSQSKRVNEHEEYRKYTAISI